MRKNILVTINENDVLSKLNNLLEIEVEELQKYSTTPSCSEARQGMETEYEQYRQKVQAITEATNYIFFSIVFKPHV